jgi:hypothetical protein
MSEERKIVSIEYSEGLFFNLYHLDSISVLAAIALEKADESKKLIDTYELFFYLLVDPTDREALENLTVPKFQSLVEGWLSACKPEETL